MADAHDTPPGWPEGVKKLVVNDLNRLGLDRAGKLYWDGAQVTTKLTLSWPQRVIALLAAIASIASIFSGLNSAATYFCGRDIYLLGCPKPAVTEPAPKT